MKGIGGGGNALPAPSYAPNAQNAFDPVSSRYNLKSANKAQSRLAIGNAAAGLGVWDVAIIGASLELGYNGVGLTQDSSKQWPTKLRSRLGALFGVPAAKLVDGVVPLSGQDDRTVLTGAATRVGAPSYVFCAGAGTATTVVTGDTTVAGSTTNIFVTFLDASTATTTATVDGGAPVNLVPAGGTTVHTVQVATNVANNVPHTVVLTSAAGNNLWGAVTAITVGSTGFRFSNLALGGSSAAFGTQYNNWSDQTSQSSLLASRLKMMADVGIVPQTYFIDLAGNDGLHLVPPATVSAGFDYIESQIPNLANGTKPDIFYCMSWNVSPISVAAYTPMWQMLYSRMDNNTRYGSDGSGRNVGLGGWDFNDQIGGLNYGVSNGAIGPDLIHPTYPEMEAIGDAIAIGFLA